MLSLIIGKLVQTGLLRFQKAVGYTSSEFEQSEYFAPTDDGPSKARRIHRADRADDEQVSYEALVRLFFHIHDPTTLNRQGSDRGPFVRPLARSLAFSLAHHRLALWGAKSALVFPKVVSN